MESQLGVSSFENVPQLLILLLQNCQALEVEWLALLWGVNRNDFRQCVRYNVVFALDVLDIGRKMTDKTQMAKLTRRAFVGLLFECVIQRLVVRLDGEVSGLQHVPEIFAKNRC